MGESKLEKVTRAKEGLNQSFLSNLVFFRDNKLIPLVNINHPSILLKKESIVLKDGTHVMISPIISLRKTAQAQTDLAEINFIAMSEENTIEGYRNLFGKYDHTNRKIFLMSDIEVRKTGVGLGTELDKINCKLLQDIANRQGVTITWTVTNGNDAHSKFVSQKLQGDPGNKKLQEELLQRENEQIAWRKIYGEGGSLGFSVIEKTSGGTPLSCKKIFSKNSGSRPMPDEALDDLLSGFTYDPDKKAVDFLKKVCDSIENETGVKTDYENNRH